MACGSSANATHLPRVEMGDCAGKSQTRDHSLNLRIAHARSLPLVKLLLAFVGTVTAACTFAADYWPQFRGPNASGVADDAKPPTRFDATNVVRWKSAVPGGVSSPIVWGERIFVTGEVDKKLLTLAYDAASGRELWRQVAPAEKLEAHHAFSSAAASTPCADGQRVYVYFNSFGVLAYDFDGKEVWRRPLPTLPVQYGRSGGVSAAGRD